MIIKYLFILTVVMISACSSKSDSADLKYQGKETVGNQFLISEQDLSYEEKVALQGEIIKQQEEELRRQENEMQELQRQEYYNKALKKYEKK